MRLIYVPEKTHLNSKNKLRRTKSFN